MLNSVPRLNPAVRIRRLDTGRIMMVYEKTGHPAVRLARRVFAWPEMAELVLDDIGAAVLAQVDGARTIAEIIAFVAQTLKLSRKEAEVALLKYMDLLARRNLVGFEIRER